VGGGNGVDRQSVELERAIRLGAHHTFQRDPEVGEALHQRLGEDERHLGRGLDQSREALLVEVVEMFVRDHDGVEATRLFRLEGRPVRQPYAGARDDEIELGVDPSSIHFFDIETGEAVTTTGDRAAVTLS